MEHILLSSDEEVKEVKLVVTVYLTLWRELLKAVREACKVYIHVTEFCMEWNLDSHSNNTICHQNVPFES